MTAPPVQLPPGARLLVRGVNWLGDAVMSTPALMRLREAMPRLHVTVLSPAKLADLWKAHPSVDAVVSFAAGESPWSIGRRLRPERFDAALIFPNSPRSALEARLSGAPLRVGYARPWRNWLLTHALPPRPGEHAMRKRSESAIRRQLAAGGPRGSFPPGAHHLHQYLHLAAALGASAEPLAPRLFVLPAETAGVRERFAGDETGGPLLGLNAGAEYGPAKRWPAGHFTAVASRLVRSHQAHWWIFGGPADVSLAEGIAAAIRNAAGNPRAATVLAGRTSLRELCAGLAACRLLLTNDTGPMHVAAAVGTPVVVPFGSTSPELTGPGDPAGTGHLLIRGDVPCAPCFLRQCPIDSRCLAGITPERVASAIEELLASPARPGPA